MSVHSKMTAIANNIRNLLGISGFMGLDAMATNTGKAVNEVDDQAVLIQQIKTTLRGKAAGGGSGGGEVVEPIIEALEITENGTYTAPDGVDGYSPITVNVPTGGGDDVAGAVVSRTITEFSSNDCTEIGDYSFRGCKDLTTVVAPNAKSVGEYAFYQCNNLRSIVLPSVTTMDTNAFRDAQYLEVVDLPKVTAIPSNAFYGCRGLKALILRSQTVVTLNNTSAFTSCYRILGTTNSGFNPNGEKIGFIYVPSSLLEEYRNAANWSSDNLVTQFRAIEDYPEICG